MQETDVAFRAGHGPYISVQGVSYLAPTSCFSSFTPCYPGSSALASFQGADRIALEQHPYFAFDGQGAEDVVPYITKPCVVSPFLITI